MTQARNFETSTTKSARPEPTQISEDLGQMGRHSSVKQRQALGLSYKLAATLKSHSAAYGAACCKLN